MPFQENIIKQVIFPLFYRKGLIIEKFIKKYFIIVSYNVLFVIVEN